MDLQDLFANLYNLAGYDLAVDYARALVPPLSTMLPGPMHYWERGVARAAVRSIGKLGAIALAWVLGIVRGRLSMAL